jgi:hypothetical protein
VVLRSSEFEWPQLWCGRRHGLQSNAHCLAEMRSARGFNTSGSGSDAETLVAGAFAAKLPDRDGDIDRLPNLAKRQSADLAYRATGSCRRLCSSASLGPCFPRLL